MAEKDFDIDGLARYLHVTPQQVERLANRGNLPGRKVGGQWRFSHAEIHHWMEERIGLLEEGELVQMEGVLARGDLGGSEPVSIAQLLSVSAVAVPLAARTRGSVITAMTRLAAETGQLWDSDKMAEAVRNREELQSTAMDNGVALLHPRRPLPAILAEPLIALGIVPQGIPFGGSSRLTNVFFLICSVSDRGHLRTLARLSRILSNPDTVDSLRSAADPRAARDMLCQAEQDLDS